LPTLAREVGRSELALRARWPWPSCRRNLALRSSTEDRYENALIDLLKKKEAGVTAGWHDHCGQNSFIKRWRGCHATRFLEEARCYKSNMRFLARS
jgi:hypothetical protein